MLVNAILTILNYLLDLVVGVLPMAELPALMIDALDVFFETLHFADQILPMADLLTVAQAFLTLEALLLLFRIGEFAYNKLRGAG